MDNHGQTAGLGSKKSFTLYVYYLTSISNSLSMAVHNCASGPVGHLFHGDLEDLSIKDLPTLHEYDVKEDYDYPITMANIVR